MSKVFKAFAANFTQISNTIINDKTISFKAKGIYMHLVSKPDGWEYNMVEIERSSTDGRESVRNGMKELEANGYVSKRVVQDSKGKITGWDYLIFDEPSTERRENRLTAKPSGGKPATSNTDNTNTDIYDTFKAQFSFLDAVSFNKLVEHLTTKYPALTKKRIGDNIRKLKDHGDLFSLAVDQMIGLDYNGLFVPSRNKPANNPADPLLRVMGKVKHESELTQKDLDWLSMAGGFKKNLVRGA